MISDIWNPELATRTEIDYQNSFYISTYKRRLRLKAKILRKNGHMRKRGSTWTLWSVNHASAREQICLLLYKTSRTTTCHFVALLHQSPQNFLHKPIWNRKKHDMDQQSGIPHTRPSTETSQLNSESFHYHMTGLASEVIPMQGNVFLPELSKRKNWQALRNPQKGRQRRAG